MKRFSLVASAVLAMCNVAVAQTSPESSVPDPNGPIQTAPIPQPNGPQQSTPPAQLPNTTPSTNTDGLEAPGLITTTLNQAPAVAATPGTTTVVPTVTPAAGQVVVQSTTTTTATIPVTKKILFVPMMVREMMMANTIMLGNGLPGMMIGPGPIGGHLGALPLAPFDEVCTLPCVTTAVCESIAITLPEACTLVNGQQLRAVLMVGGHLQPVTICLTEPCLATVTMPTMLLNCQLPMTLLIGLNDGDVLYEQPLVLQPVVAQPVALQP